MVIITSTASASKSIKKDGTIQEEDEAKIEKELADMYKDNSDYKADSNEATTDTPTPKAEETKPIARQRTSFKFQPDIRDREDVERFRTSVDDISCENRGTEKLSAESPITQSATKCFANLILYSILLVLLY